MNRALLRCSTSPNKRPRKICRRTRSVKRRQVGSTATTGDQISPPPFLVQLFQQATTVTLSSHRPQHAIVRGSSPVVPILFPQKIANSFSIHIPLTTTQILGSRFKGKKYLLCKSSGTAKPSRAGKYPLDTPEQASTSAPNLYLILFSIRRPSSMPDANILEVFLVGGWMDVWAPARL